MELKIYHSGRKLKEFNMKYLSKFRNIVKPGEVWSFALYQMATKFELGSLGEPKIVFDSKAIRFNKNTPYTRADPFVIVVNDVLYVFFELVIPKGKGVIACYSTTDLIHFKDEGIVLEENHHLSFPFLAECNGRIYMIPEACKSGEVSLYEFTEFPRSLRKVKALVKGVFADSFLLHHDQIWYLFTSSDEGELHIFMSNSLLNGEFLPHPASPVSADLRYSRSAGGPIKLDSKLFRISQDCSVTYGNNINFHEILEITPTSYRERVVQENFFTKRDKWNLLGAHHLSTCAFKDGYVVAADGKHADYWINRILLRI